MDDSDPFATASINLWRTPPRDRTSAPLYWPRARDRRVSGGAATARSTTANAVGSVTLTLQLDSDGAGSWGELPVSDDGAPPARGIFLSEDDG